MDSSGCGGNGDSLNWELLAGLRLDASQSERHKATVYFEELRSQPNGWLICAKLLLDSGSSLASDGQSDQTRIGGIGDSVKFFCLQVIEHCLRTAYKSDSGPEQQAQVRQFLAGWSGNFINGNAEEKTYVRNKVAQLYSLAFVVDYPQRWPTFIEDLAATLVYGDRAVDLFLRILQTIDGDVVDREIPHIAEENARNAAIKDRMRETCFLPANSILHVDSPRPTQLADVWYWILTSGRVRSDLVCLCLDVVALYASWIDIGLLANRRFADVFLVLMRQTLCRESVCACLSALVAKGMPAEAKVSLVESYWELLRGAGLMEPAESESGDYLASLGKLVGALGLQLVRCFVRLYPPQQQQQQQEQLDQRQQLLHYIEAKLPLAILLLGNEDDDVSHSVLEFCQEYVGLLKSLRNCSSGAASSGSGASSSADSTAASSSSASEANWVRQLLGTVISKLQLDESYDAESPGEEEAMFDEYRRDLKVLFGNLVALDGPLVLANCSEFVAQLLPRWQSVGPAQTEVAVYLLHLLGEFLPPSKSGDHFVGGSGSSSGGSEQSALFTGMLVSLVTSQVSRCPHPLVALRYFETVVRYEKFFVHNTQFVPEVLMSFLDWRGLQSPNLMVRSRVSYLLSRFVKCHKHQLRGYTEEILGKLETLLRPRCVVLPASTPTVDGHADFGNPSSSDNNSEDINPPLSPSDQMFLFESAALLIVSSGIEPQQKRALFEAMLSPLLQQVSSLVADLPLQPDEASQLAYAECAKCNIEFVSRASKAFSVGATMADNGCAEPFAQLTGAFLTALGLPDCVAGRNRICTAVRGYLHRMVICLDAGVLPYIPMAAEQLLRSPDAQDLHDFYALLGQLVPKFKADLLPFLARLLPPLMQSTLSALGQLGAEPSRDPGTAGPLRKAYLAFLASLCSNQLTEAILCQPADCLRCALSSLNSVVAADGALVQDAATCRAALGCAKGLATTTKDADWPAEIVGRQAFLAEFLLACLRVPMSATRGDNSSVVDLREAQTALFLSDLASFLVALRETAPNVILQCIQAVIRAPAAQELINLIGQCETANHKPVTNFLKTYYQSIKAA